MKRKPHRRQRSCCARRGEDDGVNPREFFKPDGAHRRRHDRKNRQLCKQVYRTLCTSLAGGYGHPILQDLCIDSVEPAPDASRLLVTVHLTTLAGRVAVGDVLAQLDRVRGPLRCEVAASLCRRKAPELCYHVTGAPAEVPP